MTTEILQDLESLAVNSHLDEAYLQTDISNFEEVEEIVKSNLRMISHMTPDENAQKGFSEHHEGYDDLLGLLNLQSSDLEEKDNEDNSNDKPVDKDKGQNQTCAKISAKSPEIPQASKDLLDDITLVINSDKYFANTYHLAISKAEGPNEMPRSDEAVGKLDVSKLLNKELIKTDLTNECLAEDFDNPSGNYELENSGQARNSFTKSVYFEQSLHDLHVETSSEILTPPQEQNLTQENLLKALKSLDSLSENSFVGRSCTMFPGRSFRDMNGTGKGRAQSRVVQEEDDDQDLTVDGEGANNNDDDSLDLFPLSYDENLTCSFYELLQLHSDDNSELIEHGRGRPPRQTVTKQAVPCKIEPKVSQSGFHPGFLQPQSFSSAFQNYQQSLTTGMPSQLQPCLGQEGLRFPVLLHRKTNNCGQLYLEVCPDITQLTSQAQIISPIPLPDYRSCSPKCTREKSCPLSNKEVASEKINLGPSADTSSHFTGDSQVEIQNQFSLEIDGPIRRQVALSQVRYGISRNNPYYRVDTGNLGHAVENSGRVENAECVGNTRYAIGSLKEEPCRMQTVLGNQNFTLSSNNCAPSLFVSSSSNSMRVQEASGFCGSVQDDMPYISTAVNGPLYQKNQNVQVSSSLVNYGTHDQPSQSLLPTNNQYGSSTDMHSHHFSHGISGEPIGHWSRESYINIAASSMIQGSNNNPSKHVVTSGMVPCTRTCSPGLPNIPVDPLSRRVQMLMAMGNHCQRQAQIDSSGSDIYSAATPQNVVKFSALSNRDDNKSMIQLSPPAELKKLQFVKQQNTNPLGPAHIPFNAATADGSFMDKSTFHPKSTPSHSSTRSSKGPDLPVPTERSRTRVEQWLNNNVMFRPDLDSGTFDPSDYSLVHASICPTAHQYPEAAGSERALSEHSYEYVGIFEGKRMTVVPPQSFSKQKLNKRSSAVHGKGSPLTQVGQNRHSCISDSSLITESSLSSGYTNSCKDKHMENKPETESDYQNKLGRKPSTPHTQTSTSIYAMSNQEIPKTRHEELPVSTKSLSSYNFYQLDENQQADLAIAEDMKQLEQTSFEKRLAGISSSTSSGHVLSELEQYLRSEIKISSETSGHLPGSSFKLEDVASGNSKQSSFDTSKYITSADIESWENKNTQNGKNSLDSYLEHVKYVSNEIMHAEQNSSDQSDAKQLKNIPLNDIAEVIGLQRELNQQPSRHTHLLANPQFDNKQKAVKRRPVDHLDETFEMCGQNAESGEQNISSGRQLTVLDEQNVEVGQSALLGSHNVAMEKESCAVYKQNTIVRGLNTIAFGQNPTVFGQSTAPCRQNVAMGQKNIQNLMQNNKKPQELRLVPGVEQAGFNISAMCLPLETPSFGDQDLITFSEGGLHKTVAGPPITQPDFLMKNDLTQYGEFPVSRKVFPGPPQTNPADASQSFHAISTKLAASQIMHSSKIRPDFQLPNVTDSFETEMHSSPSSVEMLKESRSNSSNKLSIVPDAERNEVVPASSISSAKHVMSSAVTKISPVVTLLIQSSSPSTFAHSTTTSASHMSNTHFKKPMNPSYSSGALIAAYRSGVTTYPSVGGDSDVSMSSDTSLSNSLALYDGGIDPKIQTHQQLSSTSHSFEGYPLQFQRMSPQQFEQTMVQSTQQQARQNMSQRPQHVGQCILQSKQQEVGQNMLQNTQQQFQNQEQQQQELLFQQQKNQQIQQAQKQQQIENQQQCLLIHNQQQVSNQSYYQLQKQQHQILKHQNLQFPITQQMYSQQQQQEFQNNQDTYDENQLKQIQHSSNQHKSEELLIQQKLSNQPEQCYQMQIKKQQQNQKQIRHLEEPMTNPQHQQIKNVQQYLNLQNQQQIQIQQLWKQSGEMSCNHQLLNQQQMQLLSQQHYQQMLTRQQIKKQQQNQIETQPLQQKQRLSQKQYSDQSLTFTNICTPQRTPGFQAGSTCSEPQPCHILPGMKFETRSMSQSCDTVYSQQLASLSPTVKRACDFLTSVADNGLALVPQSFQPITGTSNHSEHEENRFDQMHKDNNSGQYNQVNVQNFHQLSSGNQIFDNTATFSQRPSSGNIDIAEQDQVLKSVTETQLQKYLKEGFPSLNSVAYCQDTLAASSFSDMNFPSMAKDKLQQNLAKTGQGMDSRDQSVEKSCKVWPAERSREEADSDLSVFSLSSGEDLLSFQQDNDGETPLHLLSELPKEGISSLPSMPGFYKALNLQNKNQETALDIAVKNENLSAVEFLVSHGADVNIFCLSSQKGTVSKAVHRNETVQQTALHEAVELGNKEIVKVLLTSQNLKVDARRPDSGMTPLMLALQLHRQSDRSEIISELINNRASLHLCDTIQGKTPLMFAIQSRDVSLVEGILQQVGAEEARVLVTERAKKDLTCLHFAAELRLESLLKKRLLRCIIVAGGDPSAKNSEGETPRDWAKTDINEVLQNLAKLFSP